MDQDVYKYMVEQRREKWRHLEVERDISLEKAVQSRICDILKYIGHIILHEDGVSNVGHDVLVKMLEGAVVLGAQITSGKSGEAVAAKAGLSIPRCLHKVIKRDDDK